MKASCLWSALLFVLTFVAAAPGARAQDKGVPLNERQPVEMLTLDGAQPPTGAGGIISFAAGLLFQKGATQIAALDEKIELRLPPGYALYNKMAYGVTTKAVVSGPFSLIVSVPAERVVFDRLRILQGTRNDAEPDKLRWIDITVSEDWRAGAEQYINAARFNKLLPDFSARTIGGLTQEGTGAFAVAIKDEARVRDRHVTDIAVTGTSAPEQVMEGRPSTYTFKVTNNGPEAATDVRLHSRLAQSFAYTSAAASQGVCRYDAGNVYCNLGEIASGAGATVTINTRCGWGVYFSDKPDGVR